MRAVIDFKTPTLPARIVAQSLIVSFLSSMYTLMSTMMDGPIPHQITIDVNSSVVMTRLDSCCSKGVIDSVLTAFAFKVYPWIYLA